MFEKVTPFDKDTNRHEEISAPVTDRHIWDHDRLHAKLEDDIQVSILY